MACETAAPIGSVTPEFYGGAAPEDLAETVRQVEELGRLDAVIANAGIFTFGTETHQVPEQAWQDLAVRGWAAHGVPTRPR